MPSHVAPLLAVPQRSLCRTVACWSRGNLLPRAILRSICWFSSGSLLMCPTRSLFNSPSLAMRPASHRVSPGERAELPYRADRLDSNWLGVVTGSKLFLACFALQSSFASTPLSLTFMSSARSAWVSFPPTSLFKARSPGLQDIYI